MSIAGSGTVLAIFEYGCAFAKLCNPEYEVTEFPCGGIASVFGTNGRFVGFLNGLKVVVAVSGE